MMKNSLRFLGTGTSVGIPMIGCSCEVCVSVDAKDTRMRTSAYIKYNQRHIIIDIGPDFRAQMLSNKIIELDAILLTHPHRDHVAGFDDIRALNFLYESKIPLFANEYTWTSLKKQFYYAFQDSDYTSLPQVVYHPIDEQSFHFEDIPIIPISVMHGTMPCLGYRIGSIAYITDASSIDKSEFKKLEHLDILVLNALRKYHHPSHFTLDEAIALVEKIKPKKAFFTHLSHHMGLHAEIQRGLPENIFLAYDGLEVKF
jgi:phosphoribosyl 1,2-cyclic phosphate phosphodiesterase